MRKETGERCTCFTLGSELMPVDWLAVCAEAFSLGLGACPSCMSLPAWVVLILDERCSASSRYVL